MFKTLIVTSLLTSTINQTNISNLEKKYELNPNINKSISIQETKHLKIDGDEEDITLFKFIEENETNENQPESKNLSKINLSNIEGIDPFFFDFSTIDIEALNHEIEKEEMKLEMINSAISEGVSQTGKPYVWGATGINSFDCSMLVKYSMESIGINFPRTSREQRNLMDYIEYNELEKRDFIFWHDGDINDYNNLRHVAIYLGNEKMLHATPPRVTISKVVKNQSGKYNISYGRFNYIENAETTSEL